MEQEIETTDWRGLYGEGWQGEILAASFAHPAKFARGLIRKIYSHAMDEGWLQAGDGVVDCFGGVALGALDALRLGLNWNGVELEAKFVELGNRNIELWSEYYGPRLSVCGSARLIQGDSRNLASVIEQARCCVSSPPYAQSLEKRGGIDAEKSDHVGGPHSQMNRSDTRYGESDGQLGAMKEGNLSAVISSPPFAECLATNPSDKEAQRERQRRRGRNPDLPSSGIDADYGSDPLNLGNMKATEQGLRAVISSPPYVESLSSDDPGKRGGLFADPKRRNDKTLTATYGDSDGQLGAMAGGDYQAAIASPPFEASLAGESRNNPLTKIVRAIEPNADEIGKYLRSWRSRLKMSRAEVARHFPSKSGGVTGCVWNWESGKNLPTPDEWRTLKSLFDFDSTYDREMLTVIEQPATGRETTSHRGLVGSYSDDVANLGNSQGDSFWQAARLIVEQVYSVLSPNAHAIWVVKGFVRNKSYVDFPAQWQALCEAVGFRTIHYHRCWLVEHHGEQSNMFGEDDSIETHRKSFFRRLAESKGSPAVDYEVVLCMTKAPPVRGA